MVAGKTKNSTSVAPRLNSGAALAACVDGMTPDCSSIDSGCFPSDAAVLPDVSGDASVTDATKDTGPAVDAAVD